MNDAIVVRGRIERSQGAPRRASASSEANVATTPAPSPKPSGPTRLARMLAYAHYMRRLLDDDVVESAAEISRRMGTSRARVTQLLNLLELPTATQEDILLGRTTATERQLRRAAATPDAPLPR